MRYYECIVLCFYSNLHFWKVGRSSCICMKQMPHVKAFWKVVMTLPPLISIICSLSVLAFPGDCYLFLYFFSNFIPWIFCYPGCKLPFHQKVVIKGLLVPLGQKSFVSLPSFALNVWHIGDILCCITWSEHFRAINDAHTSSIVFMLHLAEQTANQEV